MAKDRTNTREKGIVKLKLIIEKLLRSLLIVKRSSFSDEFEEVKVPEDVKKGHFAVVAVDNNELKRFVVPLSYLTHPLFLRLLDQAADEYGFVHKGALTVPCRPSELEGMLSDQ